MAEFKLPDVGEGLTEADIVSWRVAVGDAVQVNDVIVEIETAKSLVELPSPFEGAVTALLVAEGETVAVGTPIIAIGEEGAGDGAGASGASDSSGSSGSEEIDLSNPAASGSMEGASLVGRMKADRGPTRRPRRGPAAPATAAGASSQAQLQGVFTPGGARPVEVETADEEPVPSRDQRPSPHTEPAEALVPPSAQTPPDDVRPLAKPPVRKLARDLGVDLTSLDGSGPAGSITRDDVQAAISSGTGSGRLSAGQDGAMPAEYAELGRRGVSPMPNAREVREPVKGVRRAMAQAMSASAFTAPHVTEWITVDVTESVALLDRLRGRREFGETKVSPLLLAARAAVLAMRRTPEINSAWDEPAGEVVYHGYVNLGIAAATPRGLVVPNIKDADALSLPELAGALAELAETARAGKTQPSDMSDGTFTITNVGVFGVDAGTPIINPGESAILCLGAVRQQPWVVDGQVVPRHLTTLALSFDHRHIDGQKGSRFLADVAGILEDPATALIY